MSDARRWAVGQHRAGSHAGCSCRCVLRHWAQSRSGGTRPRNGLPQSKPMHSRATEARTFSSNAVLSASTGAGPSGDVGP
jgi:hypothetical protein